MRPVSLALVLVSVVLRPAGAQQVDLEVDCDSVTGLLRSLQGMNCGPMAVLPEGADLTEQFRAVAVDFVRTHDVRRNPPLSRPWDLDFIFPDSLADPDSPASYRFAPADSQVRAIVGAGCRPYIRLGYSWESTVKYVPPHRRRPWAEVCRHVVMHYNEGWAGGYQYDIRHWEVWNEPNFAQFWIGTQEEFFALYDTVARVLKGHDPDLVVGGPGTAGAPAEWLHDFLSYCRTRSVPLDFVSWHHYGDTARLEPYDVVRTARVVSRLLEQVGLAIPHHLTEWNAAGQSPCPLYHNAQGAAYTASVLGFLQDTDVEIAHRYRANSNRDTVGDKDHATWYLDGRYKKSAYAFLGHKRLLETPFRLDATGGDTSGYALVAGRSGDGRAVTVLVSDVKSVHQGYSLTVRQLPWPDTVFSCSRYELDSTHDFVLTEQWSESGTEFATEETLVAPAVHLLRLTAGPPGVAEDGGGVVPLHGAAPGARGGSGGFGVYATTGRRLRPCAAESAPNCRDLLRGLPAGCYFIRMRSRTVKTLKPD